MNTAVVIELDPLMNSEDACRRARAELERAMAAAGFGVQERMFTLKAPHGDATRRAEAAIRCATRSLARQGVALGNLISDCFAFQFDCLTPLAHPRPEPGGIDVDVVEFELIDADSFRRFAGDRVGA